MRFTAAQVEDLEVGHAEMHEQFESLRGRYVQHTFRNSLAAEHATHGFSRRVGTMVRCVDRVFDILPPSRVELPNSDETFDATINIQAFVMNAFGCLENLAWVWVSERGVTQDDGSPLRPETIGLGEKYQKVRRSFPAGLGEYLDSRREWLAHLKGFRDALAHRIPLYIPPFTISPEDPDRYQRHEAAANKALWQGDLITMEAERAQQMALAHFQPIMTHSLAEGARIVVFHAQLLADFSTIDEMGQRFLEEISR